MTRNIHLKTHLLTLGKSPSLSECGKRTFTSGTLVLYKKKDLLREDKLPIFDYSKIRLDYRRIYTFGAAFHGALGLRNILKPTEGHHNLMTYMHKPVRNHFGHSQDIRDIAAGHGFTLMAVARYSQNHPALFGCGINHESQIGYQSARANQPMKILIAPVPISIPLQAERPNILALGAGRGHTVVSVENEGLMTLGNNSSGQCGRPIVENENFFGSKFVHRIPSIGTRKPGIDRDEVISITASYDVTICLTKKGKVYTFGENAKGQLGRGKKIIKTWETHEPVGGAIENEVIVKATCNGESVLVLSDKGEVFGWGCNEAGILIPNKISRIFYEPVPIKIKKVGKIIDITMGQSATHAVTDGGYVYSWGHGPTLGLGPSKTSAMKPTLMPPPLFGVNEFNSDVFVSNVVSGPFHIGALTNKGDVYMWGHNENGRLGLGDLKSAIQFFPIKLGLNACAIKLALGMDHTVVLTKGGF